MGLDLNKWRLVVDETVRTSNNLVTGANEVDYHYKNFNLERDVPGCETCDVLEVQEGDLTADGSSKLTFKRGIEVGNIFQLGRKYTDSMGMTYDDEDGTAQTPIMGCYGIGVGRLMSSVMEAHHDKFGPKWPVSISPWQVHLNALKASSPGVRDTAEKLYSDLASAGIEILYDDRDARPGVQFADADLLGIPFRLIVSRRNLDKNEVEWKHRHTGESGTLPLSDAIATVQGWIDDAVAELEASADSL
jgi:prolyl-tRNA synthetase